MREYYFSIIRVGCNKHVVVLKCDYFLAVEAKSSTTKVCERLRRNSIPFDSAALAPERPSPRTDCGEARNLPSHEWKPKPENEGWKD